MIDTINIDEFSIRHVCPGGSADLKLCTSTDILKPKAQQHILLSLGKGRCWDLFPYAPLTGEYLLTRPGSIGLAGSGLRIRLLSSSQGHLGDGGILSGNGHAIGLDVIQVLLSNGIADRQCCIAIAGLPRIVDTNLYLNQFLGSSLDLQYIASLGIGKLTCLQTNRDTWVCSPVKGCRAFPDNRSCRFATTLWGFHGYLGQRIGLTSENDPTSSYLCSYSLIGNGIGHDTIRNCCFQISPIPTVTFHISHDILRSIIGCRRIGPDNISFSQACEGSLWCGELCAWSHLGVP